MTKRISNNHNATVQHLSAGIADYSERMDTHYANAKRMSQAATVHTDNEIATLWESPQALREWAHENELGEASFAALRDYVAMRSAALRSAYCRACWLKVRGLVARVSVVIAQSSRQVLSKKPLAARSLAPPGHTPALNVLATCHASNAPGLFPIAMNYWQVPQE